MFSIMRSHYKSTFTSMVCVWTLLFMSTSIFSQNLISADQIRDVVWSPDGSRVAIAYQDGLIHVMNLSDLQELSSFPSYSSSILALSWSPNGALLASGSTSPDNSVRIWDTLTGEQVFSYGNFGDDIISIAWKPDGTQVLAVTAEGFTDQGNAALITPNSEQVAFLSLGIISDIAWSPDQAAIALAGTTSIYIIDASTFQVMAEYVVPQDVSAQGQQNQPVKIVWSANGEYIAVGMGDGRVFLWQLNNPQPIFTLEGNVYTGDDRFLSWIHALQFDPSGEMLTSISGDGTIRTWNLQSGLLVSEQLTYASYTADFSPYGGRAALGLSLSDTSALSLQSEQLNNLADSGISIIVPDPSLERLQSIAAACNAPSSLTDALTSPLAETNAATILDANLEVLSEAAIPPGCEADLRAVAEALSPS